MQTSIQPISISGLLTALVPVLIVIGILFRWSLDHRRAACGIVRMALQLVLSGYLLIYLFDSSQAWPVLLVLLVMVLASSWIALQVVGARRRDYFVKAVLASVIGGGFSLALVSQAVLDLTPWHSPRYLVPLAGMIFAGVMNSVSLAAERFTSELGGGADYACARHAAMGASMLPVVNSLFAVGLVSLPGMMTGQILSGVSPLVAVRYQIMVMLMLFGAAGIAAACFLRFLKTEFAAR